MLAYAIARATHRPFPVLAAVLMVLSVPVHMAVGARTQLLEYLRLTHGM